MATQIMELDASKVISNVSITVDGIANIDSTVYQGSSAISSLLAGMGHEHYNIIYNTSGIAVKIDDGTLICCGNYWVGTKNMSNQVQVANNTAIYGGESVSYANFTFPYNFSGTPVITCNVSSSGYSRSQVTSITTSSCHLRHWCNYSHPANSDIEFNYIAIGRWK